MGIVDFCKSLYNDPVLIQICSPGEAGQLAADVVGGEDLVLGTQHLELIARVHLETGHTCRRVFQKGKHLIALSYHIRTLLRH